LTGHERVARAFRVAKGCAPAYAAHIQRAGLAPALQAVERNGTLVPLSRSAPLRVYLRLSSFMHFWQIRLPLKVRTFSVLPQIMHPG